MTDYPVPPAAPPPPPAARRSNRTLLIVLGAVVLLCAIGCCLLFAFGGTALGPIMGPVMGAAQLPTLCEQNTDLTTQECADWVTTVSSTTAFQECIQEGLTSGQTDANSLYNCLEAKGAGPE